MDYKIKSDEQLMSIFQKEKGSRKRKVFDCLYLRYAQSITEYFYYSLNHDNQKAQDFMHDLFLKIIEKPTNFDTSRNFKIWLFSSASNMCKNEYRRLSTIENHRTIILDSPKSLVEIKSQEQDFKDALVKLNNDQRNMIILRYKFNMSAIEIGKILDTLGATSA